MVNQQKSKCQLRLEARSQACCAPSGDDSYPQQLAARLQSKIARAAEVRAVYTRQLSARARARVLHAQDVARGIRAKRREETRRSRLSVVSRLDEAARRRHEQLEQLQQQCKQRADQVQEKVELVRADQHDRAARARRTLAGQLDQAERRRQEQTQLRVRRLSARWQSVESVKDRVARVKFIQRWFRRQVAARTTANALRAAQKDVEVVVKSWTQMRSASFEDCMGILQQRPVVMAAQRLLKVLLGARTDGKQMQQAISPVRGKSPSGSAAKKTPPGSPSGAMSFRVLLMAGMIACHPGDIMGADPSQRLHFAAEVILADMENLASCLKDLDLVQGAQELMKCVSKLSARFAFYTEAFARWKARDAERLAREVLTSYRELLLVHRKDGARQKVEELEQSLSQGDESKEDAIMNDDSGDNASSDGSGNGNSNASSSENADTTSSSTPPTDTGDGSDRDKKDDDDEEMQDSSGNDDTSYSSPPGVNQALLADRKLVHELILNPQFQIPRDKEVEASAASMASEQSVAALSVRVREAMTKAFWDRVVEANDIETLLARTEELRTSFRGALGGGSGAGLGRSLTALADQVDGALRAEQLRELMQDPMRNVRVIEARCNVVLDAIERAEAPARAESTRSFRCDWMQRVAAGAMTPVQLLVAFLAFALDKVDELRNDVLNGHLGLLGAYLQRHGVEYEQKQLQKRLSESGSVDASFPMTAKWLNQEMQAYLARSEVDDAERSRLVRHDGAAFERFVRLSIWSLVEKHIDGAASRTWPETFDLDGDRVRACRDALDRITVISSMLALVQDYVTRRGLTTPPGFIHGVGQQLSALLRSPGISGAHLVAQAIQDIRQLGSLGQEDIDQDLEALEKRLHGAFAADNSVFTLFFSRTARAFEAALLLSPSANANNELHPSLAPFATEIADATAALRRLAQHNENVYASLYNNIIKRLVPTM
ncbi:hypothetical protein BBJ29_006821 [Phytophthora kernoviae]|uniref:Uncharacterized protein n=1 Tax=Phytophthora kernoviae TaxID=325452 RepID=A0A3F2RZW4_9STRA|nr:hypothetical protein BBJ29_006821 [Phytophthora kernoviae]RLN67553.1 hypothetical protein BBP00_00001542 [Phytophthora kernoviae]